PHVLLHPLSARAGGDGNLEPEVMGIAQVVLDSREEGLERAELAVVIALQAIDVCPVQSGSDPVLQVFEGVERRRCGPDSGHPLVDRELMPMLAIDSLPGLKDRKLGLHQQPVEIKDQRPDGSHQTSTSSAAGTTSNTAGVAPAGSPSVSIPTGSVASTSSRRARSTRTFFRLSWVHC